VGNKNIRKEEKKKKKTDVSVSTTPSLKSIVPQPEVIKKAKKI
jgi:hypothetical protein